jgi:hypothetical protein
MRLSRWLLAVGMVVSTSSPGLIAANGDIIHIKPHDNVKVVTDPSKGNNFYPQWTVFPSKETDYRKVELYVTYRCPDGQHCGEWDYIDAVYLKRVGGEAAAERRIEIARVISPYGWKFDSTWSFTWHVDITDFAFLLHDSVEVEFMHGGYESNTDRGWLVTLDFKMIKGRPAMTCLGMDTLWCGTFPYGDTAKPIESLLHPISFTNDTAQFVRLRIHQTGHGMDDSANCAEFCDKYRDVYFDDSLYNRRQIWRTCGDNPLYPQSGTWIFNRANWCPGSIVRPDAYDFPVAPHSKHTIDINMQPYINPNKPSANWCLYSYLFYYTAPWAQNDVSVEEIRVPSTDDEYSRLNPACGDARVLIKNCGAKPLTRLALAAEIEGEGANYLNWTGNLASQDTTEIVFPGFLEIVKEDRPFHVYAVAPNGEDDEYPDDNTLSSIIVPAPVLPSKFTMVLRTNKDSSHNSWQIRSAIDTAGRMPATQMLRANHTYRQKFDLNWDLGYLLIVSDTAGDGLNFWFNVEGGYGYVRLLDTAGHLLKSFNSDFGSEIRYWFTVTNKPVSFPKQPPVVEPFPPRNKGKFDVDLFFDTTTDIGIDIVRDSGQTVVFSRRFTGIKDTLLPLDITDQSDGVYWLKVITPADTITRRLRLKHGD